MRLLDRLFGRVPAIEELDARARMSSPPST